MLELLRRNYSWGVAQADRDLGESLRALRESGWLNDDSVLVVTSDHGEGMGHNGLLDHGRTVSPEVLDVFALVQSPGFDKGRVSHEINQSQDIFRTLLESAGLPPPESALRRPGLRSESRNRVAISFSEPDPSWAAATEGHAGGERFVSVRSRSGLAVWSSGSGISFEGNEAARKALVAAVLEYSQLNLRRSDQVTPAPEGLLEDLRALGYL